jgi:hypothetical protein
MRLPLTERSCQVVVNPANIHARGRMRLERPLLEKLVRSQACTITMPIEIIAMAAHHTDARSDS